MAAAEPHELISPRHRFLSGMALASANLMVVLDMTIANVSIPHISGNLGISPSQGTWVITSYAVAEAICVPLTGWLALRFGALRVFVFAVVGFGIFSVLCGLSPTLGMLVACRIGQGFSGGPIVPLSQLLLLRIFPPEKRGNAMGIWAMTTLVGPALGPILGGWISDNWSWHWIFFINVPVVLFVAGTAYSTLRKVETPTEKLPIDKVGLALMVIWIGALQIMLDIGREHDWFADPLIVVLALIAAIGLVVFVIWELTEEHPIVDLRVFRHRGFAIGALSICLGFGAYFAGIVIIPQWMQLSLGFTATWAGLATAFTGMAGVLVARLAPVLITKFDPRLILSGALIWIGAATLLRTNWTSGTDFWSLATPQLIMGLGMPFFFVTVTAMSLGSVPPKELASAAGLQNFMRIIAVAISTSVVMTYWNNQARMVGSDLAGKINMPSGGMAPGFTPEQNLGAIAQLVDREALTVATDKVFLLAGLLMFMIAAFVWLAPKPKSAPPPGAGGH
ncbi:MAG: DHA2 family efflux MFS transporter permease subunit [Pseudomonadota bacterium]